MTKCQQYFGAKGLVDSCEYLDNNYVFKANPIFVISIYSKNKTIFQTIDASTVDIVSTTPAANR